MTGKLRGVLGFERRLGRLSFRDLRSSSKQSDFQASHEIPSPRSAGIEMTEELEGLR
ncbi:MAG: hypothetical protein AB9891_01400 [Anaerolineaceae bacterium]